VHTVLFVEQVFHIQRQPLPPRDHSAVTEVDCGKAGRAAGRNAVDAGDVAGRQAILLVDQPGVDVEPVVTTVPAAT
jgi:hypothetical protein